MQTTPWTGKGLHVIKKGWWKVHVFVCVCVCVRKQETELGNGKPHTKQISHSFRHSVIHSLCPLSCLSVVLHYTVLLPRMTRFHLVLDVGKVTTHVLHFYLERTYVVGIQADIFKCRMEKRFPDRAIDTVRESWRRLNHCPEFFRSFLPGKLSMDICEESERFGLF